MAKGNVAPIKESEPGPEQLGLFEGTPVNEYKASLTAAGYLDMDTELKVGSRVSIVSEGYVSKVIFHKHKGITTRQHVIVVDGEETTIEAK
jgi:hypothetical protein